MKSGYLIEFIQQGRFMRVTAVDPATGIEVVMVGDPKQSQERLSNLAIQKLERRLAQLNQ